MGSICGGTKWKCVLGNNEAALHRWSCGSCVIPPHALSQENVTEKGTVSTKVTNTENRVANGCVKETWKVGDGATVPAP